MAHLLGAEALHLEFPAGVIFDSLSLGISEGDRIGIVGRNGEGKSTLLRLLAGRLQPDSGRVTMRRGTTIGTLDQSDTLDAGLTVRRAIVGESEEHVWAGDARVRDIVDGLVSGVPWEASLASLSGGQRRRVALAATLVGDHDLLFLDEPTNHLDVEGIAWLADHLTRRWSPSAGGLAVVTHDRWFLDEVCTTMWEVHDRVVEPFEGGYAAYVLQRVERERVAAASEAKRQNLMRKELAWLRRGPPARTTKPKFRIDAANALIANEPPVRDPVALHQMATTRLGRDVVDLLGVSVSFGDHQVLRDIEWRIAPGERTAILGANGAGKSTLLNLVTGALQPTTGVVKRGKTAKVARLSQESNELDAVAGELVRDLLQAKRTTYVAGGRELTPAQLLERLGFTNAHLSSPVRVGRFSRPVSGRAGDRPAVRAGRWRAPASPRRRRGVPQPPSPWRAIPGEASSGRAGPGDQRPESISQAGHGGTAGRNQGAGGHRTAACKAPPGDCRGQRAHRRARST